MWGACCALPQTPPPPPRKPRISPDSSPHPQKCSGLVYLVGSMCTRIVIHSVNQLFIHCSKQMHRFNVHSIRLHIGLCLEGAYLNSSAKSSKLNLRRILIQRLDTKVSYFDACYSPDSTCECTECTWKSSNIHSCKMAYQVSFDSDKNHFITSLLCTLMIWTFTFTVVFCQTRAPHYLWGFVRRLSALFRSVPYM